MSDPFRIYWLPGCSSCLRAKEFLLGHNIPFESINVMERPEAMADLEKIGFRSVPVIARGDEGVFCQDLHDVADFLDVEFKKTALTAGNFITRIDLVLQAAQRFARQLSVGQLAGHFPGRDRPFRDLVYHIFMVPTGFLEAARGGSLEIECFLRTSPEGVVSGAQLVVLGEAVRLDLLNWWQACGGGLPDTVQTYYGERTGFSVLERTACHAAQHCRQLQAVVEMNDIEPDGPLGDAELGGLPLPKNIYDNEIDLEG